MPAQPSFRQFIARVTTDSAYAARIARLVRQAFEETRGTQVSDAVRQLEAEFAFTLEEMAAMGLTQESDRRALLERCTIPTRTWTITFTVTLPRPAESEATQETSK